MATLKNILSTAKDVILSEGASINNLANLIDSEFVKATQAILQAKGKTIITGIGKSAIIAQKIVATLNSTGTPAQF